MTEIARYNIFINSSQRTGGTNTDFTLSLATPLTLHTKNNWFEIKVENVCIPFSFKTINSTNSTLNYTSTGLITITNGQLIIPDGNYNINNLLTEITTRLNIVYNNSIIAKYNPSTGNVTFSISSANTITLTSCFILNMLGSTTNIIIPSLSSVTLLNHVNVSPIKCLLIRSDNLKQPISNLECLIDHSFSDILCRIPITQFNTYIKIHIDITRHINIEPYLLQSYEFRLLSFLSLVI